MSVPIRLFVAHLPSATQSAWQNALAEAATLAGWDVLSLVAGELALRDGVDALIQGDDASLIPGDADTAMILAASPQDAVDVLMQVHRMDQAMAMNSVGWWFTQAAEAAARGVPVQDARRERLDIPGLGPVDRAAGHVISRTGIGDPFNFYAALPPAVGASAHWPAEIFTWPGGEVGSADLTGKRRLIQHGPYLLLSAGVWRVDVVFELDIHRAVTQLRFDWGDGVDVVESSHRVATEGVYAISLEKAWDSPTRAELRIWLDRSMFDGRLTIRSVKITRIG